MDDGYHDELKDIHQELMDGKFQNAARSLCSKTETIAAGRAGIFRVIGENCYDDCTENASCDVKCRPGGFCCSLRDKISDRNCPAGKYPILYNR